MGGAAGHLQHLYENLELTFGEIKDVIRLASTGKLEKASEKLDGMNLVFTYDIPSMSLAVARSGGDIKRGGLSADDLAKKFFGRGDVEVAFNTAFSILEGALSGLDQNTLENIFGKDGEQNWYSIEIIYTKNPGTINYDSNYVVFHGYPIFTKLATGEVSQTDDDSGIDILSSKIDQMQSTIKQENWRIKGPSLVQMKNIADGTAADKAIEKINDAMALAGVSDDNSVYDYLRTLMGRELNISGIEIAQPNVRNAVIERCVGAPGAPGIPAISGMLDKQIKDQIITFIKNADIKKKKFIKPIESAIHWFAVSVLSGLKSSLIGDSQRETERLRAQTEKAIERIKSSGNLEAMSFLEKELSRLGSVENINAPMEGIVFFYKGNAYKFTGSFAPMHQIVSLFKYGKGNIPKMDMSEHTLRAIIRHVLLEGGYAFAGTVEPISMEDYKASWPKIKSDLENIGFKNIKPVGSTGKKPVMGDLDLAAEITEDFEIMYQRAADRFGQQSVKKVGANIISVVYPLSKDVNVQVDVITGDSKYISWARFGTSTIKGHPDFSLAKGMLRNLLINSVLANFSKIVFPGMQTETDRTRYNIDFDRGLFKVVQTRRNKDPSKPPTKEWKTLERELISSNPDEIVRIALGHEFSAKDIRGFETLIDAVKESKILAPVSRDILQDFFESVERISTDAKGMSQLGNDPAATLAYIKAIANGSL